MLHFVKIPKLRKSELNLAWINFHGWLGFLALRVDLFSRLLRDNRKTANFYLSDLLST